MDLFLLEEKEEEEEARAVLMLKSGFAPTTSVTTSMSIRETSATLSVTNSKYCLLRCGAVGILNSIQLKLVQHELVECTTCHQRRI